MTHDIKMTTRVKRYLIYRRSLGYELHIEGEQLLRFARYADQNGHRGPVTTELALAWARLPRDASPYYWARRYQIVRCFAKHQAVIDSETEVPPSGLLGPAHPRKTPYIYTMIQIGELLAAARQLKTAGSLKPHTYETLFGLLACTGLRVSEALRLTRNDVDLRRGILTIRQTKFLKSRLVPLHQSVVRVLTSYTRFRDDVSPRTACCAFLLAPRGGFLDYSTVNGTFRELRHTLGWDASYTNHAPRIHDLRHTFACHTLLRWYREGVNVQHGVSALSTYLGHVSISSTYWYLTGIPELLAIAAAQFEHADLDGKGELP